MKVSTQNKTNRNLKNNRFKIRYAPYTERQTAQKPLNIPFKTFV